MNNPYSLVGKKILITGASSGIGRACAEIASLMGAKIFLIARNSIELQRTISIMKGDCHEYFVCDLNDRNKVQEVVNRLPKLDGVVFSAGTLRTVPTKLIRQDDMDFVFNTNFFSVVNLNTLLLQKKKYNKQSSLIFISSLAALDLVEPGNSIYSSSKAAILSFSKVLASELAKREIRVNSILPGMVRSNFLKNFSIDDDQFFEDEKKYPFGYGKPEDVAYLVTFMLSDASRWITGTSIKIDGGVSLK